ncbi:hypothetical protein KBY24_14575 [Ruegeria pomeroyi]|nr:hypothetical protein [Ruegeria pomeroyi]MCE8534615.1 hypothetical protein [Ruegeria pomeroyi]
MAVATEKTNTPFPTAGARELKRLPVASRAIVVRTMVLLPRSWIIRIKRRVYIREVAFHALRIVEADMIHLRYRSGGDEVAGRAVIRNDAVRKVEIRRFDRAPGIAPEVTTCAVTRHQGVIEFRVCERLFEKRRMAVTAVFGRRQMVEILTDGDFVVVARGTPLRKQGVIYNGLRKPERGMACAAVLPHNRDVFPRQTRSSRVIVAVHAISFDHRVLHADIREARGHMAIVTACFDRDMIGGKTACGSTIVASRAILLNRRVVKREWDEIIGRMALLAIVAHLRVARWFARRSIAVVASGTSSGNAGKLIVHVA